MTRLRRVVRWILVIVLALVALLAAAFGVLILISWEVTGTRATGERLARVEASPRWHEDHFVDIMPRIDPPILEATWAWITQGSPHASPASTPPFVKRTAADFAQHPESGLRVTWLGHSTTLVEIEGKRILIDPVWGERASPFGFAGPKRFHPPPLAFEDLPALDAVIISHDHYDHLDHPTIKRLIEREIPFLVPLGVGAHLELWGVPTARIIELDWWGEHSLGDLRMVATPARHFSGRSIAGSDKDATLWVGWAFIGSTFRVYYSGDTALFPEMADIGRRLGPFHLTLIESGAYNQLWADVHLGPEQAVIAHTMVRGGLMVPVHWGLFDLALHGWTEPIERVLAAAREVGVTVVTPRPGESVDLRSPPTSRWWPDVPWQTVEQAPAWSSGIDLPPR